MLKLSKNNDCLLLRLMQTFFCIATTHLRSYLGLTPGNQPAGFPRKDLGHGRQKVAEISNNASGNVVACCLSHFQNHHSLITKDYHNM